MIEPKILGRNFDNDPEAIKTALKSKDKAAAEAEEETAATPKDEKADKPQKERDNKSNVGAERKCIADLPWFYVDHGFHDADIRKDTVKYMEVSRLRLITFLNRHSIAPSRYRIYSNAINESTRIQPGMHHALHKPDFAFDFKDMLLGNGEIWNSSEAARLAKLSDEDTARLKLLCSRAQAVPNASNSSTDLFLAAVSSETDYSDGTMRSTKRREDTRLLCDVYKSVKANVESANENSDRFGSIEELVDKLRSNRGEPIFYVGGPFTETVEIIEGLDSNKIGPVIAMAGASHGNNNIFANQFNILADPESAKDIFELALNEKVDLTLIPTECVKDTPYQLSWKEFEDVSDTEECAHIRELYDQWHPEHRMVNPFDILAAMAVTTELYKDLLKSVTFEVNNKGTFIFTDEEKKAKPGPGLKMFWNGPSKRDPPPVSNEANKKEVPSLLSRKPDYLEELKGTLRYNESK